MDLYGRADSVIKDMNRMNLKAFDRLKLMKRDELNVIRHVEAVYDASGRQSASTMRLPWKRTLWRCFRPNW